MKGAYNTPLWFAANNGHIEAAILLVENGAYYACSLLSTSHELYQSISYAYVNRRRKTIDYVCERYLFGMTIDPEDTDLMCILETLLCHSSRKWPISFICTTNTHNSITDWHIKALNKRLPYPRILIFRYRNTSLDVRRLIHVTMIKADV